MVRTGLSWLSTVPVLVQARIESALVVSRNKACPHRRSNNWCSGREQIDVQIELCALDSHRFYFDETDLITAWTLANKQVHIWVEACCVGVFPAEAEVRLILARPCHHVFVL